jgi:ethanolamine utilization protein EutP
MKKIVLMGRSEAGKTTLKQALRGERITYQKTQYINNYDVVIDTPGEYLEVKRLGAALALYAYEADVVGLLIGSDEPYSMFPPNITCMVNRDVIGIVSKMNKLDGNPDLAKQWLINSGCSHVFFVDSTTGQGVEAILDYLAN